VTQELLTPQSGTLPDLGREEARAALIDARIVRPARTNTGRFNGFQPMRGTKMKKFSLLLSATILAASTSLAVAQEDHPYTEGPVTAVNFVRTQPGMFEEYMHYLDKTYKPLLDEAKKAGIIVDWAIYQSRPRDAQDADLILTVTYKDMAALDNIQARMDPLAKRAFGSLPKAAAAAADREKMRKELGSQLVRQLILR
jgi:hypothetical protein